MRTKEAVPSSKALSEKQREMYRLEAEIRELEPKLKGAQTRRRTAERDLEITKYLAPERREVSSKAMQEVLDRRLAKEGEYQMELDELVDRRSFVAGEVKELIAQARAEESAQRERQKAEADEFIQHLMAEHPMAADYSLRAVVSGGGASIGWGEQGRDGQQYERDISADVRFPHRAWGDEIAPASVSWGSYHPSPDAKRYGAAIMVAADIAKALDAAGIVDETW